MDSSWQNPISPFDVDGDFEITPLDALIVINELNRGGAKTLPFRSESVPPFYDVSGDNTITPIDALIVINRLNRDGGHIDTSTFIAIPLITLAGTEDETIRISAELTFGQTIFDEMGLFAVDDASGSVNGVPPSSSNYAIAALRSAERRVLFTRRSSSDAAIEVESIAGRSLYVYVIQSVKPSSDPSKHLRVLPLTNGGLQVGWEEQANFGSVPSLGNRGFDDALIELTFSEPIDRNQPPTIGSLPDRSIDEQTILSFSVAATDADLPNDTLSYSLVTSPPGLQFNSTTGQITWTPTEAQGPNSYPVTVKVTDAAGASDQASFRIQVREVNRPPVLEPIADMSVNAGQPLQFTPQASDPDIPENSLTFSLEGNVPSGLTINPATGTLQWTTAEDADAAEYQLAMRVTDNGTPPLSAARPFSISILPKLITLNEEDNFVATYTIPVQIQEDVQQVELRYTNLFFDQADSDSINDAFEVALLDTSNRPAVGIISTGRDAFWNLTESQEILFGGGVSHYSTNDHSGTIAFDVSHLPAGFRGNLVIRLVNNDQDDNTTVSFSPFARQVAVQPGPALPNTDLLVTPPAFAPRFDQPAANYNQLDWRHLSDVTDSIRITYDHTAYDTDTQTIAAGVTLTNAGQYPIRGPFFVTVSQISSPIAQPINTAGILPRDVSLFNDPVARTLAGQPFYDASSALQNLSVSGSLLPGEQIRLLLELENRSLDRFTYQVNAFGHLNRAPSFVSTPPSAVSLGNTYAYQSNATDPDTDDLVYGLISGPDGLTIDPETGIVRWIPVAADVGSHQVIIRTVDPFGADDTQAFTITVHTNAPNRPPQFISTPIVDAYVGQAYGYDARATDADFDPLTYSIVSGPAGMTQLAGPSDPSNTDDPTGNIEWMPPVDAVGTFVPVTLRVEDGRGGEALQTYSIYVHPAPNNNPPVIVTSPQIDFDLAGILGTASGTVTPPLIELDLGVGEVAQVPVSVAVPSALPMVDVFLLFDDTGSFAGTAPRLATAFPQIIDRLQADLPTVDFGFGVGRFEDYGNDFFASPVDRPFILSQPILPADLPDMREWIVSALSRSVPGGGGDSPESLIEALYQTATGVGFDGDNNGTSLDSGLAGLISTQTNPGSSGDVPPFFTQRFDLFRSGAIDLPLDTTLDVPSINQASTFAYKFDSTAGNLLRFDVGTSSTNSGQWLLVNESERIIAQFSGNAPFVFDVSDTGQYLLIPRPTTGTLPATTIRRSLFVPASEPLPFGTDVTLQMDLQNERREYTFSLSQTTPMFFDALSASDTAVWTLSDGSGNLFSERLLGNASDYSGDPFSNFSERTVDHVVVLEAGDYTLTIEASPDSTPISFTASAVPLAADQSASVGDSINVQTRANRVYWIKINGTTGDRIRLSRVPEWLLDADGLPLEQFTDEYGYPYYDTALTFGRQPTFFAGYTSTSDSNFNLTITAVGSNGNLPAAAPVPFDTQITGTVTQADPQRHFDIQLDDWYLVTIASTVNETTPSWLLQSEGGASWNEHIYSGSHDQQPPFLNRPVLLPPGTHRLIANYEDYYGYGEPQNFQFQVTAVPYINTYSSDPGGTGGVDSVPFGPGLRGGAGFRAGAVPIILVATDAGTAFQPDGASTVRGFNGLEIPIDEFLSYAREETTGGRGATVQQAIDALIDQGAIVIGLGTNPNTETAPRRTLEAISRLTGAINVGTETLDSNIADDPIEPGDPLYFFISNSADAISNGVASAIAAAVRNAPINVDLSSTDFVSGFTNLTGIQSAVRPGTTVPFDTRFIGDGQAHVFQLEFVRPGSTEILGTIPVAINDRYTYDSAAIDPDDDPVTLELVGETHGATFDPSTGRIRWRPAAPGEYTFTLRASDPYGGEDLQTWTVSVGDVRQGNTPPTLQPFAPVVLQAEQTLSVQSTAYDNDPGDQLRFGLVGASAGGHPIPEGLTLDSTTGDLRWTPGLTQVGQHQVLVRVTDGKGGASEQQIVIEVLPPAASDNHRPNILSEPLTTAITERTYRYQVVAEDLDFDPLEYSLVVAPEGMVVTSASGMVVWNPREADLGSHDVLLRVSDGRGGVAFQSFTLYVSLTNDAPAITSNPEGPAVPGSTWTYQIEANDPNGDLLRYSLIPDAFPAGATLDSATGLLTWTPAAIGAYRFVVQADDGRGGRAQQTFVLPVSDAAPPRILSTPRGPARLDETYQYLVIASDANIDDVLAFNLDDTSLARGAMLAPVDCPADFDDCSAAAILQWTPAQLGQFDFTVTATDSSGSTARQSFTLPVVPPPAPSNPPRITSAPTGPAVTNRLWSYLVEAVDPDGNTLTYRLGQHPSGMTIRATSGLVEWTPSTVNEGVLVEVIAEDQHGAYAVQSFQLPVVQRLTNLPPQFTSIPVGPATINQTWTYDADAFDPEGDAIAYSLDTSAVAIGFTIDPATGLVTWRPTNAGQQTFTVTATDNFGDSRSQIITLDVLPPKNQPPRITSIPTGPALVNQTWTYNLRAIDPENDTLTYSLSATTPAAVKIDSATGRVTWTPTTETTIPIEATVTDVAGNTFTQSFQLAAIEPPSNPANQPPTFLSTPSGPARTSVQWVYPARAIDPDNDPATYSLDPASLAAGISIDPATGRITWTPSTVGSQSITVIATDARGASAQQTFALDVVRFNRLPSIDSLPQGPIYRNRTWTYQVLASDPDSDSVSLSLDAQSVARGMTLSSSGLLQWTPATTGSFTTVIMANDGFGGTAQQTIQLIVSESPPSGGSAPQFRSLPPRQISVGEQLVYRADAFDPDGTTVYYGLSRGVVGMTLDEATGRLRWHPSQLGLVDVEILAIDQAGETTAQSFTLEVVAGTSGNRPPEITSTPKGPAARNLPYRYPVLASDPDGDTLTYELDPASLSRGLVINSSGIIEWVPTEAGDFPITVTVSDSQGARDTQSFTLTVIQNAPPRITSAPPQRLELGQQLSYQIAAQDPNPGDTLTYHSDSYQGLVLNAQSGLLTWTPTAAARYTFNVYVTDNHGARDSQTIDLLVVDPNNNQPPSINGSPRSRLQVENQYVWQIPASDPDLDSLAFELLSGPAGLTIDSGGLLNWTPSQSQLTTGSDPHLVSVQVNDGRGGNDKQTWLIAVSSSAANQAPRIDRVQLRAIDYRLEEGQPAPAPLTHAVAGLPYQALFAATDPDGDTLIWSLVDAPKGVRIDARGLVDYRPTSIDVGSKTIIVQATDTSGVSDTHTYTLVTRGGNSPAILSGDPPVHHRRSTLYQTSFTATDADDDPVTFRFVPNRDSHGAALDPITGQLTWTPTQDGTYRFFVAAADPLGAGTQMVFDVLVDQFGPNDPPKFENTSPGVAEVGSTYTRKFPATDPDGDALTYAVEAGPDGLSINVNNAEVTWNPPQSLVGSSPQVSLTATDRAGNTARYQFPLPVRAANNTPRFDSTPQLTVTAGNVYRYDVLVSDPDNDPLTISKLEGPASLALDPNTGRLTWTTTTSDIGNHAVTISLTDSRIPQPVQQTWTISVVADETAPQVHLIASPTTLNVGDEVAFEVRAQDNVGIAERTLTVGDINVALSSSGFGQQTMTQPGRFTAIATAVDAAGNTSTDEVEILVRDPNNAAPVIRFTSPTAGSSLTAPTRVQLSVTDAEQDLVGVRLLFAPADGSAPFRQFASLIAAEGQSLGDLVDRAIGNFDPTNLANGAYVLRAIAEDAGFNQSTSDMQVQVEGRLKLGNFRVSFDDLTIPVSGIPITIVRSYDTLDASKSGDFGYGWSLEVRQATVRIDSSTLGGIGSGRYQAFINGTRVIVTTPDGTEEGFTFQPIPDQTLFGNVLSWKSYFRPDDGNMYKLEAPAGGLKLLGNEYLSPFGTTYNPQDAEFGNAFQVTSIPERITYNVNARTGQTASFEDRNGNRLTVTPNGIVSSTGRSVTFQRDMLGRIIVITDPRGNSLRYGYDTAGNLTSFTNRMGNTINMTYHDEPAHYLDTVIDPLGNQALKANYTLDQDDNGSVGGGSGEATPAISGRLESITDATGSAIAFAYDRLSLTQTIRDDDGIQTIVQFDSYGNPLDQLQSDGQRTTLTFDDPASGLPATETQVIGGVDAETGEQNDITVTRTYNRWGQVTSETDNRGNVTRFYYDSEGVPYSTVNPDGSSTYYSYDEDFNLTFTSSSSGTSTSMTYDEAGQVTEVRTGDFYDGGNTVRFRYNQFGELVETKDSDDVVREIQYDANGNQTGTEFVWTNPHDSSLTETLTTSHIVAANDQPLSSTSTTGTTRVQFDSLDRPYQSVDEFGFVSESIYDLRGLTVESRRQTLDETGTIVWLVMRTVYDEDGKAIYTTDNVPEGTPASEIFGIHTVYDSAGRIIRTENRKGVEIELLSQVGRIESRLVSAGTLISASESIYDSSGRVIETIDDFGRRSQTLFDRFGQTIETRSQSFNSEGTPVWLTARTVYDSLGRVILSTDRYVMPVETRLGEGASPAFYATANVFDNQGRSVGSRRLQAVSVAIIGSPASLTAEIAATGELLHESKTVYDARGRVTRSVSPTGQIMDYVYDSRDRRIATIGHPLPAEQVGLGARYPGLLVRLRSETVFDRYGQVAVERSGIIQVETNAGMLVSIDTTDARETHFRYDAQGRQVLTIHADGSVTKTEYDNQGRVIAEVDPLDRRHEMEYDALGRLTAVTLPAVPNPASPDQLLRPRWEYLYDAFGNQVTITDNLAETTSGEILRDHDRVTGDDTRTTRFQFNSRGQQLFRTLPAGNTEEFRYDDRGRLTLHISFEGVVTETRFDDTAVGGGRVESMRYFANLAAYDDGAGSPDATDTYTYDEFGRVTSVERQSLSLSEPLTSKFESQFDARGRLIRESSPTGNVNYEYDSFDRQTRVFTGYGASRAEDAQSPLTDVRYGYDSLGRLSTVESVVRDSQPVDGDPDAAGNQPEKTRYFYDLLGRMDFTELPNQVIEDYSFDLMDRLVQMRQLRSDGNNHDLSDNVPRAIYTYNYDPDRDASTTNPTDSKRYGLSETVYFDTDNNPSTLDVAKTTVYAWDYDSGGRLIQETIDHWDDSADRTETFVMDLVGNRLERNVDYASPSAVDQFFQYQYDANDRLLRETQDDNSTGVGIDQVTTYDWGITPEDPDGTTQQLSKTVTDGFGESISKQTFVYNLQGHLHQVVSESFSDGEVTSRSQVQYEYNPSGIRIKAAEATDANLNETFEAEEQTGTTEYLIDANNHTGYAQTMVETTKNAGGKVTKRITYVFGQDEITQTTTVIDPADSSTVVSTVTHTFGHDGHGSVRALFEAAAAIAQVYTYTAYGELLTLHNSSAISAPAATRLTQLGYSGEAFDARIGQQYLRARWYNPSTGRFNRLDPFAGSGQYPKSLHKYAYVHGDPIGNIDPSGMVAPGVFRMIARLGTFAAYRILLGWAAEYTLRKAYETEVNRGGNVWFNRQIGRVGDADLPPGGMQTQFKLKPDIHDRDRNAYYEIKPSNAVGIALGLYQLEKYDRSIAERWPDQVNSRGNWVPRDIIYWLKVPNFLRDTADGRLSDVLIELPLIIIGMKHSPGLVLYDELTLSMQAAGLTLGTEALARILLNLSKRLGKAENVTGLENAIKEALKPVGPLGPNAPRPLLPNAPNAPIGAPPTIVASFTIIVGIGGF